MQNITATNAGSNAMRMVVGWIRPRQQGRGGGKTAPARTAWTGCLHDGGISEETSRQTEDAGKTPEAFSGCIWFKTYNYGVPYENTDPFTCLAEYALG